MNNVGLKGPGLGRMRGRNPIGRAISPRLFAGNNARFGLAIDDARGMVYWTDHGVIVAIQLGSLEEAP